MAEISEKVLLTLTEDCLETGLRGVPVGYCTTSFIDPVKGLHYRGIPINELVRRSIEEVIYLIWYGKLPEGEALQKFSAELLRKSHVDRALFEALVPFLQKNRSLKAFSAALALAGDMYGTGNYEEDGITIIAKVPVITAGIIRMLKGKSPLSSWDIVGSCRQQSWLDRFLDALGADVVPPSRREEMGEILRLFLVLHMDHGGGNLSTFVGKAIASGLEDMYGSLAGAMLALDGPRHGRANQDCLDFIQKILEEYGEDIEAEKLASVLRQLLAQGGLVYGYGHAVLRVEDARAAVLYDVAEKQYAHHPYVKIALLLRKVTPDILKENPKIADPYANVDAISGPTLLASGFAYPDCMPLLFGSSRIVGIARQIVYERVDARDGRGTPIIRPKYVYKDQGKISSQGG